MAIENTAWTEYRVMSGGIGAGGAALKHCPIETIPGHYEGTTRARILELGSGQGHLLHVLARMGHACVGIDISSGGTWEFLEEENKNATGLAITLQMDLSHERIPFVENYFHFAFCTETIEHLSNPYWMVAETKRVLMPRGRFCVAFPRPEDNLGYGCGKHSHIYPGFLQRESFEQFMTQLYFRQLSRAEHGSSVWYTYENHKTGQEIDLFKVVSGNYDGNAIYEEVRGDTDYSE